MNYLRLNISGLLLAILILFPTLGSGAPAKTTSRDTLNFNRIDIVHVTHTDYGYTDHPTIALDLHKRYLDIALDLALESRHEKPGNRFTWTAEALDPFYLWWQEAPAKRRKEMLSMIESGQIGVNAMPFHIHPFVAGELWEEMTNWMPDELYKKFKIEAGMQHDVNGFPRSAAIRLLNKDIRHIWTGINGHWGGSPFKLPTAFWWKMPDNRKMLVWAGFPYWEGYTFFAEKAWRADQRPAYDTEFSWPRDGDVLCADEKSVREAHAQCLKRLKDLRSQGYEYPFVALSFTNQWRMDNDGPLAQLVPFVKKWNELGLKPALRMTTAAQALKDMEGEIGGSIATYEGEWQDWWSFGLAASPPELQAARHSMQLLKAVQSPLWGELPAGAKAEVKEISRMLCRYYEHTFASNETSSKPFSLFNLGQMNEKNTFAFRPLERSKWLLGQLTRSRFTDMEEGLYVANTGLTPYTGWVDLDVVGFRGANFLSVLDPETNTRLPLRKEGITASFWVDNLAAASFKRFVLDTMRVEPAVKLGTTRLNYTRDENNWVGEARWTGMSEPLFSDGLADFLVLGIDDMNRWAMGEYIHMEAGARKEKIDGITHETWAKPGMARIDETDQTIVITQEMEHPRLKRLSRRVELYKNTPRAKVRVEFDRISSLEPEVFYARFPFPKTSTSPLLTNGGVPYVPYSDNLPNSCKDFFVTDGWVKYTDPDGMRVWSSTDVPLINFGGHHFCTHMQEAPEKINELYGMLYNNVWVVNFQVNYPGEMVFEFEIFFDSENGSVQAIQNVVDTYSMPIVKMNNPKGKENKYVGKYMNTPRVVK